MTINPEVPFLDGKGELATPTVLAQIDARTKVTMRADLPALAKELKIGGVDEGVLQSVRDTAEAAKTTSDSASREAKTAHALAKSVADGAGMGPGSVTDGAVASVVLQQGTQTQAAVANLAADPRSELRNVFETSAVPALQSTRAELALLQNETRTPQVRTVPLITVAPDQKVRAFAGQTVEHREVDGRTAWKVTSTGSVCRVDLEGLSLTPGPVNALGAWVWIENPQITTAATLIITGPKGSYTVKYGDSRTNSQGARLRRGWQFFRVDAAGRSAYANLQSITGVSVRFTVSGPTTNAVGVVDVETRPKASLVIVNDWGSKPFYDVAYPDMRARGWPVVWAPRTWRFGEATYPDNMTTLDEVRHILSDGVSEVSFHSPDGTATLNLTPSEARDNAIRGLVGLKVHDLLTRGALWRAAWVQNQAPGAWAAQDLFVASATPNDRYHPTCWPPLDRYDIPRVGIHGTGNNGHPALLALDVLEGTHGVGVFYTHAVTPDGSSNHASKAQWDAFRDAVDAGVAEGWLEVVSFGDLLRRDRLVRDGSDSVQAVVASSGGPIVTDPTPEPGPTPTPTPTAVTTLATGTSSDPTPATFGGQTVTHAGAVDGRQAWSVASQGTVCRFDVAISPPATPPAPTTVSAWVYVADPALVSGWMVSITGAQGTWTRTSTHTGVQSGWPLKAGWNELRMAATAAPVSYLAGITAVSVRLTPTAALTAYVGQVSIES